MEPYFDQRHTWVKRVLLLTAQTRTSDIVEINSTFVRNCGDLEPRKGWSFVGRR
jgi:hypothetical protein